MILLYITFCENRLHEWGFLRCAIWRYFSKWKNPVRTSRDEKEVLCIQNTICETTCRISKRSLGQKKHTLIRIMQYPSGAVAYGARLRGGMPPRLSLPSAFLDRKGETFRFYISAEKPPARECGGEITSHGVLGAIKHAIVHPYGASNREARCKKKKPRLLMLP